MNEEEEEEEAEQEQEEEDRGTGRRGRGRRRRKMKREEELVEITIKDKKYYKNEDNNDLYSVLEDGEPGELIGKYVNNKIEKRK